jgi:hypothetical protein
MSVRTIGSPHITGEGDCIVFKPAEEGHGCLEAAEDRAAIALKLQRRAAIGVKLFRNPHFL